ncbi:transposable element Tcb2 transposase [Trichonephila clavipes]|nr:transposable element Tcb2 transposase [Trichonephila clavipes]
MINGRTRLHVVANGTMTGQRYIDEVLLPHVRLFRGAVGDKFVFMDDNATCHRTLAVQDGLDSEGIQRLVWPARSPDLNPIENVWDALGRQVAGRNYPPTNKNILIRALTEEWDKLPQQLLENVVQNHKSPKLMLVREKVTSIISEVFKRSSSLPCVGMVVAGLFILELHSARGKYANTGGCKFTTILGNTPATGFYFHLTNMSTPYVFNNLPFGFVLQGGGDIVALKDLDIDIQSQGSKKTESLFKANFSADEQYKFKGKVSKPIVLDSGQGWNGYLECSFIEFKIKQQRGYGLIISGDINKKPKRLKKPLPSRLLPKTVPLTVQIADEVSQFGEVSGGKGSSLGKLMQLSENNEFIVPKGIIVTTAAYQEFLTPEILHAAKYLEKVAYKRESGTLKDLEEGRSVTSVAAEFGIAHSIVSRLWRQFQTTGTAIRGLSSGRPRRTTPADDRYIVLQARRNRRQTAGEIARHTTQATGRPISRFTVARRLHGGGLFARRPVRCVPLTPALRRRRSLWCREHRNWRDNEWGRVLFTDESRFSWSSDSHRILIWREQGSRNHPSNIIERERYGGRGVLVWGGIMLGSRTDLHIFDAGSVNGTRYCNDILLPYVRLFRGSMGLQFLFMDDNAPCHHTVAAEQLLESEDIERMDWPERSPDLNPIEHVWDFLGRSLAARTLPPVTIRELRLALQDEWADMPQQLIDTLIISMGRRCETCLAVRGDHIPY